MCLYKMIFVLGPVWSALYLSFTSHVVSHSVKKSLHRIGKTGTKKVQA